jgi:hypothetical protein
MKSKTASLALKAVDYIATLFFASCLMTGVLRWALGSDRFESGTSATVCIIGLALNATLLSIYYWFRLFVRQPLLLRILESIVLAIVSTAITIPASSLIEQAFGLPSLHVPGAP